jgi:hypothetical protein
LEQNAASFDELLMRPGLRWNVNFSPNGYSLEL